MGTSHPHQTVNNQTQPPPTMDFVNKFTGGDSNDSNNKKDENKSGGGGIMDSVNNFAGGGKQGEKNEDGLDKAVDFVQEKVMGQGDQSNESAAEQARTRPFPTSSASSTRTPLATSFSSRTRTRSTVPRYDHHELTRHGMICRN